MQSRSPKLQPGKVKRPTRSTRSSSSIFQIFVPNTLGRSFERSSLAVRFRPGNSKSSVHLRKKYPKSQLLINPYNKYSIAVLPRLAKPRVPRVSSRHSNSSQRSHRSRLGSKRMERKHSKSTLEIRQERSKDNLRKLAQLDKQGRNERFRRNRQVMIDSKRRHAEGTRSKILMS